MSSARSGSPRSAWTSWDHDHPVAAPHDALTARQLDQRGGRLPSTYRRQEDVPRHVRRALGHPEPHLAVPRNHIALLNVPPAASNPQRHPKVGAGLHLAELVAPRRRVTAVQDHRVNARLALLDAENDPRIRRAPALELAPHCPGWPGRIELAGGVLKGALCASRVQRVRAHRR
jgi:hypothetical protein